MTPVAKQCVEKLQALFSTMPGKAWEFKLGDYIKQTNMRAWVSAEKDGSISISLHVPPGSGASFERWEVTIDGKDGRFVAYDALEERIPWGRPGLPEWTRTKALQEGQDDYEFAIREIMKALTNENLYSYEGYEGE